MILKMIDNLDRWWFFDLDGYVRYKEINSIDLVNYTYSLAFSNELTKDGLYKGLILNFYTKNGKEETVFTELDTYLLNDNGHTIEVLYR